MTTRSLSVDFGVAQTGVGYLLKDASGADVGSRVTSGIAHIAGGVYLASVNDAGAVGVYWDCAASGVNATEIFSAIPAVAGDAMTLTGTAATQLVELHRVHGLELGSPLSVTATTRAAGGVTQTISEVSGTVTVQRT